MTARTFTIGDEHFELDGQPFQIISGAMHYFRVHPDLWEDRLVKARQLGLNTIETYVAWNFHSREQGEFRTDGQRDLGRFIDLAAAQGLHVIVRPGPYICAEWRSGGLPDWLLAMPGIGLRRSEPRYLEAVSEYYAQVLEIVAPRLITRGGPVISLQIENEYGAYGDDADYLRRLTSQVRDAGVDVPLLTCDQANDEMLKRGGLPELHRTATFGSRPIERLATLRRHQPRGPLMCMEFWGGWFDSWGRPHHITAPDEAAAELDTLLTAGASVNLYMFHGGTNAGTWNGANHKGTYLPITTSYDYDAPLAEDGTPTAKYWAFREVIARHAEARDSVPAARQDAPEHEVHLHRAHRWEDILDQCGPGFPVHGEPSLDALGGGITLAEFQTEVRADDALVLVDDVRDRADASLDGVSIGELDRTSGRLALPLPRASGTLSLLLEDRGRVNYGPRIGELKGIHAPRTRTRSLEEWTATAVPLDDLPARMAAVSPRELAADAPVAGPVLVAGAFETESGRDHFLRLDGFTRGFVWINGVLVGRYSSEPPTRTLYVPGPLVRGSRDEVTVLELHTAARPSVRFVARPDLGHVDE